MCEMCIDTAVALISALLSLIELLKVCQIEFLKQFDVVFCLNFTIFGI